MESVYQSLFKQYTHKYQTKFEWMIKSKGFGEWQRKLNIDNYQFILSETKHFKQVLKLLVQSYKSKNSFHKLFYVSQQDLIDAYGPKCKWFCSNGRAIFAINKSNGKLEGAGFGSDIYDIFAKDITTKNCIIIVKFIKLYINMLISK